MRAWLRALLRAWLRRPCPRLAVQVGATLSAVRAVTKIAEEIERGRPIRPERFRAVAARLNRS